MSETLDRIKVLVAGGEVKVSDHGYDELAADDLLAEDVFAGLAAAEVVEDYPTYPKGPCVLTLQRDTMGNPIHVLWGIPGEYEGPAVLVTAYRPDPSKWSVDFKSRKQ
ncbi:MAG TPA: DUF4258 domain-containing protein [Phycisphaerae bacterium]|nr:DUF4258 domain-containing protein [Phycisphaerae bacterium]